MGQIEAHVFLFCRSINAFQFDLYSMSAILVEAVCAFFCSRVSFVSLLKVGKADEKTKSNCSTFQSIFVARANHVVSAYECVCEVNLLVAAQKANTLTLTLTHKDTNYTVRFSVESLRSVSSTLFPFLDSSLCQQN